MEQYICMTCGRRTTVGASDKARGWYRCGGCGKRIKILSMTQAKSLLRKLARRMRARLKHVRLKGMGRTKGKGKISRVRASSVRKRSR